MWAICASDGFGAMFEPYCGKSTKIENFQLGQGPNVVLNFVKKIELKPGTEVFFDNLFTSFPLLQALSDKKKLEAQELYVKTASIQCHFPTRKLR